MYESFSTVDAARVLGVHRFTVARWLDAGVLQGYRTAGGHRRVARAELVRYLHLRGLPIPPALASAAAPFTLLAVMAEAKARAALKRAFRPHAARVALTVTGSGVEAVLVAERLVPGGLLVDVGLVDLDPFALCRGLRAHPRLIGVRVAMSAPAPTAALRVKAAEAGAWALIAAPVRAATVLAALRVPRL